MALPQVAEDIAEQFSQGMDLFLAGRYADAIPFFQQVSTDARSRAISGLYLGKCFRAQGFLQEATTIWLECHAACDDSIISESLAYEINR